MKNITQLIKIAGLIAKSISRQISSGEEENLYIWKKNSSGNERLYNKIADWNNFQKRNQVYQSFDAEKAWGQFSQKINRTRARVRLMTFVKYAAAIILPLILGGTLFYYFSRSVQEVSPQVSEINPGTKNAIIVLDDGESVNLDDRQIKQLVEEDGTIINKKNGVLNYSGIKSKKEKKQLKNTLIVPRGGEYNLVLSDGSRIFLNSVSKLSYPVTFNGDKREVSLEGEAFFEISKNKNKPFIVNINGMKIQVLGTSFNVKAYADEDKIFTTLVKGKIKLNTDQSENDWVLVPDQQAVLDKNSDKVEIKEVHVQQFISWKNGVYTFTDQTLEEIMRTLSRWYDFEYDFADESLKSIHFEGGLNKYEDILPILDIMQSTGKLNYKIEGKRITFIQKIKQEMSLPSPV